MQVHAAGKCWTWDWNDLYSVPYEIDTPESVLLMQTFPILPITA